MTPWCVAAGVAVVLAMPGIASAGWRANCRAASRECRMSHGASLVTTSTTLERTTCPSQNCSSAACILVNGYPYVDMFDALNGECELFRPPDCGLCAEFCSSTTTTTTT